MEDLIGVGVTDPAHQARVGESPLHCVILTSEYRTEDIEIGGKHVDSSWVHSTQTILAIQNVERSAAFRACFGERESAAGKVEGCQALTASKPHARPTPM